MQFDREFFVIKGRKGGIAKSKRKKLASLKNLAKANQVRKTLISSTNPKA